MENVVTMKKNGTTFTVVLRSAEHAKLSFEDVMKRMIERSALELDPAADDTDFGMGCDDEEEQTKLSQL